MSDLKWSHCFDVAYGDEESAQSYLVIRYKAGNRPIYAYCVNIKSRRTGIMETLVSLCTEFSGCK